MDAYGPNPQKLGTVDAFKDGPCEMCKRKQSKTQRISISERGTGIQKAHLRKGDISRLGLMYVQLLQSESRGSKKKKKTSAVT